MVHLNNRSFCAASTASVVFEALGGPSPPGEGLPGSNESQVTAYPQAMRLWTQDAGAEDAGPS